MERPELLRSLIIHEPSLLGLLSGDADGSAVLEEVRARLSAVAKLIAEGENAKAAETFVDTVAFEPGAWQTSFPEPAKETFILNAPTFLGELAEEEAFFIDLQALRLFSKPTFLTEGGQSPPFFKAIIAKLVTALPQAQRHTFQEAGHVPHLSYPEVFASELARFAASSR